MFARYLGRLTQVATGAVVSGTATSIIQPNEANNAIDRTSQQSTTLFETYKDDDFQFRDTDSTTIIPTEQSMLAFGVTGSEFNSAVASLQEHPDIIFDILPSMNFKRRNQLFNALNDVLNNPQIISTVKSKINGNDVNKNLLNKNNEKKNEDEIINCSIQWEKLKNEHPCVICQDLLAKPTILQCSHSFCGSCLDELFNSSYTIPTSREIESNDGGIDIFENNQVIHQCPTCKQDILQHGIFERTLDDVICAKTELIHSCPEKTYWIDRRNAHEVSKQLNMNKKSKYYDHNVYNQSNEDDDDDDSWESIQNWAIPAIAFVVITLIAICRYK